jgi:hypothetical protein
MKTARSKIDAYVDDLGYQYTRKQLVKALERVLSDWKSCRHCDGGVYPGHDGLKHSMKCEIVNRGEQL